MSPQNKKHLWAFESHKAEEHACNKHSPDHSVQLTAEECFVLFQLCLTHEVNRKTMGSPRRKEREGLQDGLFSASEKASSPRSQWSAFRSSPAAAALSRWCEREISSQPASFSLSSSAFWKVKNWKLRRERFFFSHRFNCWGRSSHESPGCASATPVDSRGSGSQSNQPAAP